MLAFSVEFWQTRFVPRSNRFYVAVMAALMLLAIIPWWTSTLLPLQDYPQFLVFVRAIQDYRDPSSPFFGTYKIVDWPWIPTALPLHLTVVLSRLVGSVEIGAKLLMTLHTIALPLASAYLLEVLRRDRWQVLFVFPLLYGYWTVGGFASFCTSFASILLTMAYAIRWLQTNKNWYGILTMIGAMAVFFWHGVAFLILGLALVVIWVCWRPIGIRRRLISIWPMIPSGILYVIWSRTMVGTSPPGSVAFASIREALARVFEFVGPLIPYGNERSMGLVALFGLAFVVGAKARAPGVAARWRIRNPMVLVSLVLLSAYFLLPFHLGGVAGISNRFVFPSILMFVFACGLPRAVGWRRFVLVVAVAVGVFSIGDLIWRLRVFHAYTVGASRLMDRMKARQTLYMYPGQGIAEFYGSSMVEMQQFATARHGGLPNSSFAGYNTNYVRYARGFNPMPQLNGPPQYGAALTRFDYVMIRGNANSYRKERSHFRFIARDGDWTLFGVCGSKAFPSCKR